MFFKVRILFYTNVHFDSINHNFELPKQANFSKACGGIAASGWGIPPPQEITALHAESAAAGMVHLSAFPLQSKLFLQAEKDKNSQLGKDNRLPHSK